MPWLKHGINRLIPSVIWQPAPPLKETLAHVTPKTRIVDIGAGGRRLNEWCITVDRYQVANTDVQADIHNLPIKSAAVDCIVCTGTLEHIHEPERALVEFYRLLVDGGIVHIEVPFMQPFHADPHDYYRWTLYGLEIFCERNGFHKISSGVHLGPASAMNEIVIQSVQSFFSHRVMRKFIEIVLSFLLFPFKYLDYFLIKKKKSFFLASGVYFIGRKSNHAV